MLQREEQVDDERSQLLESRNNEKSNGVGEQNESNKIGVLPLAALIYFIVTGGPVGLEEAVRSGGFLWTLVGFSFIGPLIWLIPEALMTAELGSTYPEASGGVAWVEEAFGSTAGVIVGYLSWVGGATDNAIYPVLCLEYFHQGFLLMAGDNADDENSSLDEMNGFVRFLLLASSSIFLALVNYRGLKIVGNISIVIGIFILLPFFVMCLVGLPKVDPTRWLQTPDGGRDVMWRPLLNNIFWCLNFVDSAGNLAGDVRDPATVFPQGVFWAVVFSILSNIIPLLIAIGATNGVSSDWVDGYMVSAASQIAGPWLGIWIVLGAGAANISLFHAEMSSDSFQLLGMAERGLLPQVFAKRSQFDTPTYGILLGTAVIVVLCTSDFSDLVEMLNFNYSISLIMEYAAFVKLRVSKGEVHRPYRVPLNTFGSILLVLPPCCLTLYLMVIAQPRTYLFCALSIFLGFILFGTQFVIKRKGKVNQNHVISLSPSTENLI